VIKIKIVESFICFSRIEFLSRIDAFSLKIMPLTKHNGLLRIFITRNIAEMHIVSPRLNSFSLKMMEDLSNLLDDLHNNGQQIYGLILNGENKTFCTGFDIKCFGDDPTGVKMCSLMHSNYLKFASLPMVTVAAIEGYAIGGGAELSA